MPHPAKIPQTKQVPLVSPTGGVVQSAAREQQPMGGQGPEGAQPPTCWDALNVLPYDIYGRERVAERFGITKKYDGSLGLTQIQGMQAANFITPTGGGGTIGTIPLITINWGETNSYTTTNAPGLATGIKGFTGTVLAFNTAGTAQNITLPAIGFNTTGSFSYITFQAEIQADSSGNGGSGIIIIPTPWNTQPSSYNAVTLAMQVTGSPSGRSINANGTPILTGQNWQGTPFLITIGFNGNPSFPEWSGVLSSLDSSISGSFTFPGLYASNVYVIPQISVIGEVSVGQTAPIYIQ